MILSLVVVSVCLIVSCSINIILFIKRKKPKKVYTIDAKEVLRDLALGSALLRITRIDPDDVYLRSPKDH